jgi:hypothetical protein
MRQQKSFKSFREFAEALGLAETNKESPQSYVSYPSVEGLSEAELLTSDTLCDTLNTFNYKG